MAPAKTRSKHSTNDHHRYKADPEDTNDDDDIYGMRELKHQLASLNLQLKDTMGDGNCLFRACADQFSGTEKDHPALRAEVCQYIENHEEHFKLFLDNETVEAHLGKMRRNGTYGGNIELVAFARMKNVDIKVYQPGYIYVIEGVDVKKEGSSPGQRPVMHIAYHSWEHYSSIRNIDGPFEGPPEINPRPVKQEPLRKLTNRDPPRSIERAIMKTTGVDDLALVRELMEKYRGDVDSVYNDIYERQYPEDKEEGKEEERGDVEGEHERPSSQDKEAETSNQGESKARSTPDVNTSDLAPLQSPESQKDTGSSPENTEPSSTPSEGVKGVIPKKRLSAREKKEAAKRNQKQKRKEKGKTHLSGGDDNSSSEKASSTLGGGDGKGGANMTSNTMRELFV
ncbi:hypothetical protein EC957_006076 [Mortierella hygrophila]|uniref:OTU domain-containing protein n=1 Tax=Mortierella hygrophila TaxID=979708 RepID=A0A9P6EZH7_9FUNG|nr:hypothetical protein EC957_006076 [Mortierella hygrophila]